MALSFTPLAECQPVIVRLALDGKCLVVFWRPDSTLLVERDGTVTRVKPSSEWLA